MPNEVKNDSIEKDLKEIKSQLTRIEALLEKLVKDQKVSNYLSIRRRPL